MVEFGNTISSRDKRGLATLIYYPEERVEIAKKEEENIKRVIPPLFLTRIFLLGFEIICQI